MNFIKYTFFTSVKTKEYCALNKISERLNENVNALHIKMNWNQYEKTEIKLESPLHNLAID